MKKLISAKDIENAVDKNEKIIYITKNTIITPLAEEIAKNHDIEFSEIKEVHTINASSESSKVFKDEFDIDMIYKAFSIMKDKGILSEMLDLFSTKPYIEDGELGGLRIIRGDSVKYNVYNTGNINDKVHYQELINKEDSLIGGFLTIEDSKFERSSNYMEMGYVIDGNLDIEINGKAFTAYSGDVLYIPSDTKVVWSSKEITKLFYIRDLSK